ncbi:FUSC family protein [Azomonas macrocytogenes]|uniref:Integral membrane bound transporter domain-containing protein n=1 Tax=Azomonas macrocytogenes TaxID=69962 RepID=A0A839SZN3_AZOMA|nr:FUSC family protein [Azomonas macrocytogenes]MBB3101664.1 hypothetical protein [Azomonas macrocytogenes]
MQGLQNRLTQWFGRPAWAPAVIATIGCALPLLMGISTRHPGFFWATIGAFMASLAHPLQRLGMPGMLLMIGLGAVSIALGFWAANDALSSVALFACCGLLLAWLQRYGNETGKLGISLAICFCLGQSQYGLGNFDNPYAIAALFILGGLWVSLLGFGLRGVHGLRMWPEHPGIGRLGKILKRQALRTPPAHWWIYAMTCLLASMLGSLCLNLFPLHRGYWLTLPIFAGLHLSLQRSMLRILRTGLSMLALAFLLIFAGYNLANTPLLSMLILLPLILLCRAYQAQPYGFFAIQTSLCFLLLTESLAQDWDDPQSRLINVCIGAGISLLVTLTVHTFWRLYLRISASSKSPGKTGRMSADR